VANLIFNVSLGRVAAYADLPQVSDGLVLVPLEASGLVGDSTMRDYDTLADILAGATNEQTSLGRKTLTGVTVTVDDTNDRVSIDAADVVWTTPTGNPVGAVVICYDSDTGTGTDSALVPLAKQDVPWTPDGTTFTLSIADFARVTSNG
jgi:hypothetical protein